MKFIVVGCGSIGARHARNLAKLKAGQIVLVDTSDTRAQALQTEIQAVGHYRGYEEALRAHPDAAAVVIATPTSTHVPIANFFIKKGINIFMEKPLSSDRKGVNMLVKSLKQNPVVFMVGQSYRFHEGFLALKKLIDKETIGKIYHVNYFGGQYLPDWHPKMDYRTEYAAQKRLGGGVFSTSMSHSFDTAAWLFGEIKEVVGWKAKLSDLEIDVDDSVFCMSKTERGVVIMAQSDFLQRFSEHRMIVVGEKGSVEADFITHTINLKVVGKKPQVINYSFEPNKRYIDEMKHFISLIKDRRLEHDLDIHAGKRVVELLSNRGIEPLIDVA